MSIFYFSFIEKYNVIKQDSSFCFKSSKPLFSSIVMTFSTKISFLFYVSISYDSDLHDLFN